jgi:hypothetical protein
MGRNKKADTVVLSMRVPVDVAEKVDAIRKYPDNRQTVIKRIFLPALDKYLKRQEKVAV